MKTLIFIFFLFMNFYNSQNLTLIYELRYKSNLNKDEYKVENYYLDIMDKKSIFRLEKNRKSDSLTAKTGFGLGFKINYNDQFDVIKNDENNAVHKIIFSPLFRDVYFITPDKLEWKILLEKMKIGVYDCQKAEVDYGGRTWTAWFTTKIPISDGPYIFNKLPGMIIKISDENSEFNFDLISIKINDWANLYETKKGREINWETYKNLQLNYYNQPFSEAKALNIPMARDNGNGNPIRLNSSDMKNMEDDIRRNIRENNNPIEKNYKVEYK